MTAEKLKKVFNQFQHNGEFRSFKELASGHINDTYLVITSKKPYFVLQRINHGVFKDVPGLIENKVTISNHIREKLKDLPSKKLKRRVLTFAKTNTSTPYYKDEGGNYWNLMYFIDKSVTHDIVTSEEIAYEGGRLLGQFLTLTSDFDTSKLVEVIPKFHDMSFRYEQFEDALKIASQERLERAKEYIKLVADLKEEMHIIQNLKESGEIKLRVTHNDTKISNALFNKKNKGLCLIDTDTVMPGIVHYDFGDAIRTICNTAAEDETDLDMVEFNLDYYKAYKKGFLKKMKSSLSPVELRYLPLSAKTMIFIMALRFLTDYLNNDIYYKTKYPEHNLDRAKNQFKLIQSFTEKIKQLEN
ncbi:aminoglycoside phosphotransferase family protein [Aureibaculum sp. 2210JD6-5]|uniref:phosphotransferase enzyme family protein n=1 Tax=Aureibaculum sp. 2210JD6-5 TaxID=3103957 RepID=UPI002AADE9B5|nr:aminoglycoside phosphotransferase family protein [Aureibaculum sp. 2210JD6-5]MDY7396228.1 aminoglycoside phosphotransferase family protein [Aureibaculum sp. 2210JD6-5]